MSDAGYVFSLFANCVPVKGARRSLICDLHHHRAQFIPNGLFYILTVLSGLSIQDIKGCFSSADERTIDEYFQVLLDREYGFITDEPWSFPHLSLEWDCPEKITNSIIDINADSRHNYHDIFSQLDGLGCQAVQVRAYDALSLEEIEQIVTASQIGRLRHLDLIVKFQPALTFEVIKQLCWQNQVISGFRVHSSPFDRKRILHPLPVLVAFHRAAVVPSSCGEVAPAYFSLALEHFTEAHHFNTCLNRKLTISTTGDLKSCPALRESYGNISHTPLLEAAKSTGLVRIGAITKDQVSVCRDCEFRYVCTDCRAYLADPDNLFSKPAKCKYDPYTATWATS
jgi:SPASM domain peptide maturase of grasp-with-spasm system